MRRLFTAAFASMLVGVASGLFYREFTKINGFPRGRRRSSDSCTRICSCWASSSSSW